MPDQKPGKKSKRPDERPARIRYWLSRRLEKRKVKRIMKSHKDKNGNPLSKFDATKLWREMRQGRVPKNFLRGY